MHPDNKISLRLVTTSAEPISVGLALLWKEVFADITLLNLYGATECSSNALVYDTNQLDHSYQRVPIGEALANVRIYIVDEYAELVPYGLIGEMCIAGDCLAKGSNFHIMMNMFIELEIWSAIWMTVRLKCMEDGIIRLRLGVSKLS